MEETPAAAATERRPRLGERLVQRGLLTPSQIDVALKEQRRTGEPFGRILVGLGFVTEEAVARVLFESEGTPFVSLREHPPDPSLLSGLDREVASRLGFVPLRREGEAVVVAMANPADVYAADEIRRLLRSPLRIVGATRAEVLDALRRSGPEGSEKVSRAIDAGGERDAAIRIVDELLAHGVERGATDIHLEPEEKLLRVRYRVDGVLVPGENVPAATAPAVLARVKLLAGMDISEHRLPQDGRIRFGTGGGPVDLRASALPTVNGETLVLRILDSSGAIPRLDRLGLSPEIEEGIRRIAVRPNGIFFVTGPTGSGKSTTLFALLATVDAMERKICTVEDPVEYRLPLARQCQVNPEIGLTFAAALRSILRQDPDVLLIGETRDLETAQIAVRAALTGHLLLTTLHTTSAVGAVARLLDMGIEPFLLTSTLAGALGQRLVRRVCRECSEPRPPLEAEARWFEAASEDVPETLLEPRGCLACAGKGYRGRVGVFELYVPSEEARDRIARRASTSELLAEARARGHRVMVDDGRAKVRDGGTTMAEVLRVTTDAEGGA